MNETPTKKQRKVLRFIARHVTSHGYPPTLREICTHLGTSSTNGASCHLDALVKKGCLVRTKGVARGMTLTPQGRRAA